MEQQPKIYVFDKKEIALIFSFMIVIAVTAFTLGVRVGKKMMFTSATTMEEEKGIELKSQVEEQVQNITEEESKKPVGEAEVKEDAFNKLQKEMDGLDGAKTEAGAVSTTNTSSSNSEEVTMMSSEDEKKSSGSTQATTGKFTIQLGSYPKLSEAKDFADAFTVRGYNPILTQVKVSGKAWYRVSLGSFETMQEAKDYIKKEESLFGGQEYVIVEMK